MMKRNDFHVSRLSARLLLLLALLLASPGGLQAKATDADTLRVLAIGNSFSQDAVEQYLHELGKSRLYHDYRQHVYRRMFIGTACKKYTQQYTGLRLPQSRQKWGRVEIREMTIEKALADEPWDYVSLQQASPVSGIYETYKASLPELVDYVNHGSVKRQF